MGSRKPSSGAACCFSGSIGQHGCGERKAPCLRHGQGGGHATPEWMLHSNLRLLCGNHFIIKQLKEKLSKNMAFTGY